MYDNTPLVLAVLTILKDSDVSLSLYQLMKILEKKGYELEHSKHNLSVEMRLFRKNFIVMNALYQLKADLFNSKIFMCVSSLKIKLHLEYNEEDTLENADDQKAAELLSKYYLDWDNYNDTGENEVVELLNGFWRKFKKYSQTSEKDRWVNENDKRLDALQLLGVESSASWKDIQQSYRQLVTVYHPDKGGDSLKFIKIREAYLILKLMKI